MFPFVGQNLVALSFVYRLLSETGFRITHINDECKRYGQPSVFLTGSAHATESAPVILRVHLYEKRND